MGRAVQWQPLFIALLAGWHGVAYAALAVSGRLPPSIGMLPAGGVAVYAILWCAIGVVGVIAALWTHWSWAKIGTPAMLAVWSAAYAVGWVSGEAPTAWFFSALYFILVGITAADPVRDWWRWWIRHR